MIQFSHGDEKITKLFSIIFWTLVGFHIIFGCISELIYFTIDWLNEYQIVDTADIQLYVTALGLWAVS